MIEPLVPIVVLVAIGAALLRAGFYDDAFRRQLDRFIYWVSMPALIVAKLATSMATPADSGLVGALFAGVTAIGIGLAYGLGALLGLRGPSLAVFVQGGFRGNLAFVAIPVILMATAQRPDAAAIQARALLVFAPMVLIYNIAAVAILEAGRPPNTRRRTRWSWARSMSTNPLIAACVVGLSLKMAPVSLPSSFGRSLSLLGDTAAPLALVSLGGALVVHRVRDHWVPALGSALVKVAVLPALGWFVASRWDLPAGSMLTLLVFCATPTAVASHVLASQFDADEGLAASAIVASTLLCVPALAVALALPA